MSRATHGMILVGWALALAPGCRSEWKAEDADGDGFSWLEGDCDDSDPGVGPREAELCDGVDNDCDGTVDEADAQDAQAWYVDLDGDGHGAPGSAVGACTAPDGHADNAGDCDDTDATVNPDATETCNFVDDDCNGETDDDPTDGTTWYTDGDGDGYGDSDAPVVACSAPDGTATDGGDCDDDDATSYPGATTTEVPGDGVDADCDGEDACTDADCDGQADLVFGGWQSGLWSGGSFDTTTPAYLADLGSSAPFKVGQRLDLATTGVAAMAAADLDKDGYVDLVAGGSLGTTSGSTSTIHWGGADGLGATSAELGQGSVAAMLVQDLDADGWIDVVLGHHSDGSDVDVDTVVYWGNAGGLSDAVSDALPTSALVDLVAADLDGDARTDLVVCNHHTAADGPTQHQTASTIYWGTSTGFDVSTSTSLETVGCSGVASEDLDGDGLGDLVFASHRADAGVAGAESRVYLNDGARFAGSTAMGLATPAAWRAHIADLDGDGDLDLLFGAWATTDAHTGLPESGGTHELPVTTWFQTDDGSFEAGASVTGAGCGHPLLVDLDDDGLPELVCPGYADDAGSYRPDSSIWWGTTTGFDDGARDDLRTEGAVRVIAHDLDGDGWLDLVFSSATDGDEWGPDGKIYWGSAVGYSDGDRTSLTTDGSLAAPLVIGG